MCFDFLYTPVPEAFFVLRIIPPDMIKNVHDKSLTRPGRKQATAREDFDVHISYL